MPSFLFFNKIAQYFLICSLGRPAQLQNCTVSNQSSDSLEVDCVDGFDGGLPQSFFMEILELPTLRSRLNLTTYRAPPSFLAEGLDPGTSYRIMLYAVNAKGRSDPTVIDPVTFKGVAKLQGELNAQKPYFPFKSEVQRPFSCWLLL